MVSGMGRYFEIWSLERWESQDEALQDADANNRRFSPFDLSTEL
jgi:DNA-binding transcriptional regulator/RsmH inhibitor MraZ